MHAECVYIPENIYFEIDNVGSALAGFILNRVKTGVSLVQR